MKMHQNFQIIKSRNTTAGAASRVAVRGVLDCEHADSERVAACAYGALDAPEFVPAGGVSAERMRNGWGEQTFAIISPAVIARA